MGRHRTPEEKEELRRRATEMRVAGIGTKRIARDLGIGGALACELLRDVPVPSSLTRPQAKDELREAAVLLRRQGRTYDEIQADLGVSKGSLSLWLRDLGQPTAGQRAAIAAAQDTLPLGLAVDRPTDRDIARELRLEGWLLREIAAAVGAHELTVHRWTADLPVPARAVHGRSPDEVRAIGRAYWDATLAEREEERRAVHATAAAKVGAMTDRDLDVVAAVAYWCEGSKSKPWQRKEALAFINSDPDLIRVWLEWLRRREVDPTRWRLALSIHESADVASATQHWADVAQVRAEAFMKPSLKRHNPTTVRKNTGTSYVGCLVVRVLDSRLLYQEIEGIWRGVVAGSLTRADSQADPA